MSSNIDVTKPLSVSATTASVRANFLAAKTEIEALQALLTGTGAVTVQSLTVSTGNLTVSAGQILPANGTISAPAIAWGTDGLYKNAEDDYRFSINSLDVFAWQSGAVGIASNTVPFFISAVADLQLHRDTNDILAQRRGTNAQAHRNYGRFVSASDANYCEIAHATTTLASVSGATVTATSLIPDGAICVGISTTVTVGLGVTGGTTGYQVGDGADADRWGTVTGTTAGTDTDNTDWTTTAIPLFNAAQNIVITANGGNFDGTGSIFIDVSYLRGVAV